MLRRGGLRGFGIFGGELTSSQRGFKASARRGTFSRGLLVGVHLLGNMRSCAPSVPLFLRTEQNCAVAFAPVICDKLFAHFLMDSGLELVQPVVIFLGQYEHSLT